MCDFYFNRVEDKIFYTIEVNFMGKSDYLKLHKLPIEMKYMAYYLQEAIKIKLSDSDRTLEFVCMHEMNSKSKAKFMTRMESLEVQYFGGMNVGN